MPRSSNGGLSSDGTDYSDESWGISREPSLLGTALVTPPPAPSAPSPSSSLPPPSPTPSRPPAPSTGPSNSSTSHKKKNNTTHSTHKKNKRGKKRGKGHQEPAHPNGGFSISVGTSTY